MAGGENENLEETEMDTGEHGKLNTQDPHRIKTGISESCHSVEDLENALTIT